MSKELARAIGRHATAITALARAIESLAQAADQRGSATPALLYRVEEACRITGHRRTKMYNEIAAGKVRTIKYGKSVRIPADALREYMDGQVSPDA